jgi:cytochrome c biogenesis protein
MASENNAGAGRWSGIWDFFASVRLSVILLLSLALASIIGTLIPQNGTQAEYLHKYGLELYRYLTALDGVFGLFDMYHSWWFQLLLLLLTANVLVCSLDRFRATWRLVFAPRGPIRAQRFRNLADRQEFTDPRSLLRLQELYPASFGRAFRKLQQENNPETFRLYGESGRWSRLGVYLVHGSVMILLLGGLIGSLFGFEGYVDIPEGERTGRIRIRNSGQVRTLPFEIECEDFEVRFYASGAPQDYRSRLTLWERGAPVLTRDVRVNTPLRYRGINIFQSSYRQITRTAQTARPPEKIVLSITSKASGMRYQKEIHLGETIDIPEALGQLTLKEFRAEYAFRGSPLGEVLLGELVQADGSQVAVVLPLRFPGFDKMSPMFTPGRHDDLFLSLLDYSPKGSAEEARYATGLQVTHDPGVTVVYVGFVVMILGCLVTFFMSHQQCLVEVTARGETCRVVVAGTAHRNKMAMQRKVRNLARSLRIEAGSAESHE